jgi:hypothetical protein
VLLKQYAAREILHFQNRHHFASLQKLCNKLPVAAKPKEWENIGGQLIEQEQVTSLLNQIKKGQIRNWDEVHGFYRHQSAHYGDQKLAHALAIYRQLEGTDLSSNKAAVIALLEDSIRLQQELTELIQASREKDYENTFRQMVYESAAELEAVVGKLDENSFIVKEQKALRDYRRMVNTLLKK